MLLVFLLIVFGRWQLGIDEINSIFLFFIPKETDVSHFHTVYGSFRLMNLIKINGYCQTKGSSFTEIAFVTFCPFLALSTFFFCPPLSSFLLSFSFPFPLYLFFLNFFFLVSFSSLFLSINTFKVLLAAIFFCNLKELPFSILPLCDSFLFAQLSTAARHAHTLIPYLNHLESA